MTSNRRLSVNGAEYKNASKPMQEAMLRKEIIALGKRFEQLVEADHRKTDLNIDDMCSNPGENRK